MTKVVLVFVFACAVSSIAAAAAAPYAPLPLPPAGFDLREVAQMPENPVRVVGDPSGKSLYVLAVEGNVYRIDLSDGKPRKVIDRASYSSHKGPVQAMGLAFDRERRMYIVENGFDMDARPAMNHITIYRFAPAANGQVPTGPRPWFKTEIPFAVGTFQHGVSHIAQGPDGFIYVSSGSRTDHGEAGSEPNRSREGETPTTACIWQLDPRSDAPELKIYARGIRNAFGFCWDDRGRMFATENGPNADPEEELNLIEPGKHYGFPFVFAEWKQKAYDDQPDAPPGFTAEPPVAKFDPHSSPSGIVFHRGRLLVARYGNLLTLPNDVGFDLLEVKLTHDAKGSLRGQVAPLLAPIARPTDLHLAPNGKLYLCEHQRQLRNGGEDGPGRILELSPRSDDDPAPPGPSH